METAVIVKIAVSAAPYSIDKPYDYLVPEDLMEAAVPGVRVTVPFGQGNRESEGIILARVENGEKHSRLKPLKAVLDAEPVLDSEGIALALWMRQRYFCTLFDAVKTIYRQACGTVSVRSGVPWRAWTVLRRMLQLLLSSAQALYWMCCLTVMEALIWKRCGMPAVRRSLRR